MSAESKDEDPYEYITEGHCKVSFPKGEVFYNPVQVLNRDLSILFINLYNELRQEEEAEVAKAKPDRVKGIRLARAQYDVESGRSDKLLDNTDSWVKERDGLRILEALAASGLRSIRYVQEIPGLKYVVCNDIEAPAVESIRRNAAINGIDTKQVLLPSHADATLLMYQHRTPHHKRFDVVDLDPYGSPTIFLDSAVQCIDDGGLLCVTCTDMPVLCGNQSEACFSKYNSTVNNNQPYCHEYGLRVVLATLEAHANRYGKFIQPLASFSIDFYCRVFVRVFTGREPLKLTPTKLSYVIQCRYHVHLQHARYHDNSTCDSFQLQPLGRAVAEGRRSLPAFVSAEPTCSDCKGKNLISGPIWSGRMIDEAFLKRAVLRVDSTPESEIPTHKRLLGLLTVLSEEAHDAPLYYSINHLCNQLHLSVPKLRLVQAALINEGYSVSQSHCEPHAVKTNAPSHVIWDIMRSWNKKHPNTSARRDFKGTVSQRILAVEPTLDVNWEIPAVLFRERPAVARFPHNPEKNWGPKARAKKRKADAPAEEGVHEKRSKLEDES